MPIKQHQVPSSPKYSHHHNKNECVGSTSTSPGDVQYGFVQMDDDTIAHTKPFEHYTTLMAETGLLSQFLDVSEGGEEKKRLLLNAKFVGKKTNKQKKTKQSLLRSGHR